MPLWETLARHGNLILAYGLDVGHQLASRLMALGEHGQLVQRLHNGSLRAGFPNIAQFELIFARLNERRASLIEEEFEEISNKLDVAQERGNPSALDEILIRQINDTIKQHRENLSALTTEAPSPKRLSAPKDAFTKLRRRIHSRLEAQPHGPEPRRTEKHRQVDLGQAVRRAEDFLAHKTDKFELGGALAALQIDWRWPSTSNTRRELWAHIRAAQSSYGELFELRHLHTLLTTEGTVPFFEYAGLNLRNVIKANAFGPRPDVYAYHRRTYDSAADAKSPIAQIFRALAADTPYGPILGPAGRQLSREEESEQAKTFFASAMETLAKSGYVDHSNHERLLEILRERQANGQSLDGIIIGDDSGIHARWLKLSIAHHFNLDGTDVPLFASLKHLPRRARKVGMKSFRDGPATILVSTSAVERGHDIGQARLFIEYTPAAQAIRTIQRRGRVGRRNQSGSGPTGEVITLVALNTLSEVSARNQAKRLEKARKTNAWLAGESE